MPDPIEKPAGAPATAEERRAALAAGDDIFDEGTTDNTAASYASPEDIEAARKAEEALKEEEGGGGETPPVKTEQNGELAQALNRLSETLATKPTATEEESKQLTAEELDKVLNKFEVSDELLAELDNPETRKAALRKIAAGAAKEGATMSALLVGEELQKLRAVMTPILQAHQQQQLERQQTDFFTEYPVLNDEAYKPVINAVAAQLKNEGVVPKTVQEARKILAERTEAAIKSLKPDFSLKAGAPKTTQPKTTTIPKQATVSTKASTGGAGSSKGTPKAEETGNRTRGTEVFD